MGKRILLFLGTNLLILATISIVLNLLGVAPYLSEQGINYQSLMIFCLIWGMGGAFISLMLSKTSAKWMLKVETVDPDKAGELSWLVDAVAQISRTAGLRAVPEIGIYNSPEVNAFATGPSQRNSLVAFSTGLLQRMSRDEILGVAAHEVAHIKNGDMVTMTLLQGVMNAVVMFLARIIAFFGSQLVKDEGAQMGIRIVATIALDILLGILGSIVVMWFSRHREFRADSGAADLVGREKMIAALEAIKRGLGIHDPDATQEALATLKISQSGELSPLQRLFRSHPDLDDRIAALKAI